MISAATCLLPVGTTCWYGHEWAPDLDAYERFLPTGDLGTRVAAMVDFYVGLELDWDLELALPAGRVAPVRLGATGRLGWTSWLAPPWSVADDALRADLRLASTSLRRPQTDASHNSAH